MWTKGEKKRVAALIPYSPEVGGREKARTQERTG